MATKDLIVKIGVDMLTFKQAMEKLSKQVAYATSIIQGYQRQIVRWAVLTAAIQHYGIPESDIRRVILKEEGVHQVQLWNWRKIDIPLD